MLAPSLLASLGDILPVRIDPGVVEDTRPYECDGLTLYREQPLAVLLPEDEAQVVAILQAVSCGAHAGRRARRRHRPLRRRAAGHAKASCCRWRSSGASWRSIRSRAPQSSSRACATSRSPKPRRRIGLYYAPDPSSQIACTIGGNVAENSGGVHCLKYGLTVHNVRRVRGVTIDGEVVEFGGDALDAPGYDLLALMNGSEGLLAVITEVTVKLTPKPQDAQMHAGGVRRPRAKRARPSPRSSAPASFPRASR